MDTDYNIEDEYLDDAEIFSGEPDFDRPQVVDDATNGFVQDDGVLSIEVMGFLSRSVSPINTWRETLQWYRDHQTKSQIGFDPDGMCLKVCRTARKIPAKYLSARESQDATPEEFRVYKISELRRGMVLYYDDPVDDNPYGHIVTLVGRRRDADPNTLRSLLVETNTVKRDELVIVQGDYFGAFWGDDFKFGATWLNGVELDFPTPVNRLEKFDRTGPRFDLKILDRMAKNGNTEVALIRDLIVSQVRRLPDNPKLTRVREFKEAFRSDRELRMMILNEAAKERPDGLVKKIRDEIRRLIASLPDE